MLERLELDFACVSMSIGGAMCATVTADRIGHPPCFDHMGVYRRYGVVSAPQSF